MIKKPITIQLANGLEARPVALLVQVASQFESEIHIESGKRRETGERKKYYGYDDPGSWHRRVCYGLCQRRG